jgi:hypothetical protein
MSATASALASAAPIAPAPRPPARFGNGAAPADTNRPASRSRSSRPWRGKTPSRGASNPARAGARDGGGDAAHEILFQKFFKSVGPRTYAAQVKRAKNGNHYLVLMEGRRDEATGEVRKTRLFIYSEDFVEFFRLAKSAAEFIKGNPVPEDVRKKQEKRWARQAAEAKSAPTPPVPAPAPRAPTAPRA